MSLPARPPSLQQPPDRECLRPLHLSDALPAPQRARAHQQKQQSSSTMTCCPASRLLAALAALACLEVAMGARVAPQMQLLQPANPSSSAQHQQQQQVAADDQPTQQHAQVAADERPTECDERSFRKSLLVPLHESPLIGLFEDVRGQTKFEASGMTVARDRLWVVFDNLHALGKIDEHFHFRDPINQLVGALGDDSQFEGLTYVESTGHFYAVEEVADHEKHGLVPVTHELVLSADETTYTTIARCPVHFELTHANKGFEGIHYHEDEHGHKYLVGLCEGNYCRGGEEGKEAGNGRIVVAEFNGKSGDECGWDVVKVVKIPRTADFTDYSGMAFRGDKVAIISQENSAMWLGMFDFESLQFTSEGSVYNFPRDAHCRIKYCNVEGIQWLDDVRFVVASDKAKRYQPFYCMAKEQRVSIFALPDLEGHDPFLSAADAAADDDE